MASFLLQPHSRQTESRTISVTASNFKRNATHMEDSLFVFQMNIAELLQKYPNLSQRPIVSVKIAKLQRKWNGIEGE